MDVIKCSTLKDIQREFNDKKARENEKRILAQKPRGILVEAGALSKDFQ
jgi:hypothetical protein